MKIHNFRILSITVLVATIIALPIFNRAFADTDFFEGEGGGATGTEAGCNNFMHGHTTPCGPNGDGSWGGGASWHLYSTKDMMSSGSAIIWQKLHSYQGIIANDVRDTMRDTCYNAERVAVFAWDGPTFLANRDWAGGVVKWAQDRNLDIDVQFGPIKYESRALIDGKYYSIGYNNYDAKDYEYAKNSNESEMRLSATAAQRLYNEQKLNNPGLFQDIDTTTGWFCVYSVGLKLYADSGVTATRGGTTKSADTGIVSVSTLAQNEEIVLTAGANGTASVELDFHHKVYASSKSERDNVTMNLKREYTIIGENNTIAGFGGNSIIDDAYTIEATLGDYNGTQNVDKQSISSEEANFENQTIYQVSGYDDDGYNLHDEFTIKFSTPGIYNFCEKLTVVGEDNVGKQTKVDDITITCSQIVVKSEGNFYAVSNAKGTSSAMGDMSPYETTHIINTTDTVNEIDLVSAVGENVTLTFSHGIYTNSSYGSDNWYIDPSRLTQTKYSLSRPETGTIITSSGNGQFSSSQHSASDFLEESEKYSVTQTNSNTNYGCGGLFTGVATRFGPLYDMHCGQYSGESDDSNLAFYIPATYTVGGTSYIPLVNGQYSGGGGRMAFYAYSDNFYSNSYVARNEYKITFKEPGDYTFCERINLTEQAFSTEACINVSVAPSETTGGPEVCKLLAPDSYINSVRKNGGSRASGDEEIEKFYGVTSVLSRVINTTINGDKTNNKDSWSSRIYVRPGDEVEWANCYYPGAQKAAYISVTDPKTHAHGCDPAADPKTLWKVKDFDPNGFTVEAYESRNIVRKLENNGNKGAGLSFCGPMSNAARQNLSPLSVVKTLWGVTNVISTPRLCSNVQVTGTGPQLTLATDIYIGVGDAKSADATYKTLMLSDLGSTMTSVVSTADDALKTVRVWEEEHTFTCCEDGGDCDEDSHRFTGHSITRGSSTSSSSVTVPYNFTNSTSVTISPMDGNTYLYAGEAVNVSTANLTVGVRDNKTVGAEPYATQVDNAIVKLTAFVSENNPNYAGGQTPSDSCNILSTKQCEEMNKIGPVTLNPKNNDNTDYGPKEYSGNIEGTQFTGNYSVFDASAGDWFCVIMSVFPASSGDGESGDTTTDPAGNRQWRHSPSSCIQIAKKPSFQIWGGSLFTESDIATNYSNKHNLYDGYSPSLGGATTFGSWVEEGIISGSGSVRNLASGAAIAEGLGGYSYCRDGIPLSIPNTNCSSRGIGGSGIQAASTNREALVNYWAGDKTVNRDSDALGAYELKESPTGKQIHYSDFGARELDIDGYTYTVEQNNTRIIKTSGVVNINSNIEYKSREIITEFGKIPKMIIYASGGINIASSVTRIDAILITNGNVDTCADADSLSAACSNQLIINGSIIANSIDLNRNYGNAAGKDESAIPAEIINYDTSAIVWGNAMADKSESDTLITVYQRELAPRY